MASSLRPLCETLRQCIRQFLATRLVNPMDSQCISCGVGGWKACVDEKSLRCPLCFVSAPTQRGSLHGGAEAKLPLTEQVGETGVQALPIRANPRAMT